MRQNFTVSGMSCAACSAHVEKAVSAVNGVSSVSVNLITGKMTVEYTATSSAEDMKQTVINAVKKAGYDAAIEVGKAAASDETYEKITKKDKDRPLNRRFFTLAVSLGLIILLIYISMGQMLGAPVPYFIIYSINPVSYALVQMFLSTCIIAVNRRYYISGFKKLFSLSPNMDSLIALGSGISFIYSIILTADIINLNNNGYFIEAAEKSKNLFFESAGMIPVFISIGKYLEEKAKRQTYNSIHSLMKLKPKFAVIFDETKAVETETDIKSIKCGDILCVRPGEGIPCDGEIIFGTAGIDESMLTGESLPVDKTCGDKVFEATINRQGYIRIRAEKTGEETVFSKIIRLVEEAAGSKAPIQRLADKISMYFIPAVLFIAIITFLIWLFAGYSTAFAISMGVSVMVISCPCSLGLATPTAIMAGTGRGAEMKILIKSAEALEALHRCDTVCLDKTGTVTTGELSVSDFFYDNRLEENAFLSLIIKAESRSTHPISAAISGLADKSDDKNISAVKNNKPISHICELNPLLSNKYTKDGNTEYFNIENVIAAIETCSSGFKEIPGYGISIAIGDSMFLAGNMKLIRQYINISENGNLSEIYESINDTGKSSVIFALCNFPKMPYDSENCNINGINISDAFILGIVAVRDSIRKDAAPAVKQLLSMNKNVLMLTGDNKKTAAQIAASAGIKDYIASLTPEQKLQHIKKLQADGHNVVMAGDGINDAPSLNMSDVGIAIGNGTDAALESADIVILSNNISSIADAFSLSGATIRNIKQNLFWALFYNCLAIPLAAGVLYPSFSIKLNPMIAAGCMSLSSLFVVTNALRLRFYKKTGGKTMKVIFEIDGMMCEHCKARVEQVLGGFPAAASCSVDLGAKTATVELNNNPEIAEAQNLGKEMSRAVTDAGYKVISVKMY